MKTELIRGEVVIEQVVDDEGKLLRWRRMAFTVPVAVAAGMTTTMTFRLDLPGNEMADEMEGVALEPWTDIVRQMGAVQGGFGDGQQD